MLLLIGRDWPGFPEELLASQRKECPKPPRRVWLHPVLSQTLCLARKQWVPAEEAAECESNILANLLSHMYTQVTQEGNFGQEQKEDS